MKKVSNMWKKLSEKKKQKYYILASQDKDRYYQDTETFTIEFERIFGKTSKSESTYTAKSKDDIDQLNSNEESDSESGCIKPLSKPSTLAGTKRTCQSVTDLAKDDVMQADGECNLKNKRIKK